MRFINDILQYPCIQPLIPAKNKQQLHSPNITALHSSDYDFHQGTSEVSIDSEASPANATEPKLRQGNGVQHDSSCELAVVEVDQVALAIHG